MRYFISKIQFRGFGIFEDFFCTFFGGKNFLPWQDSLLSQLPEEFLHLDILPHLTQITPKRSLKIAIRSHAATQSMCVRLQNTGMLQVVLSNAHSRLKLEENCTIFEQPNCLIQVIMGLLRLTGNIMCNHVYADLYCIIFTLFCPMCYHPVVTVYLSYPP